MPRLREVAARVAQRLGRKEKAGRAVTLKLKEAETPQVRTRQKGFPRPLAAEDDLQAAGAHLLRAYLARNVTPSRSEGGPEAFRLVGLTVSALTAAPEGEERGQLNFAFEEASA